MNQIELQNKLWSACYQDGALEQVKDYISRGCDINARAQISGAAPLDAAIYGGHIEIVKYLIEIGANPNAFGYEEGTMLMAAANQGEAEFLKMLCVAGADPNLFCSSI